MRLHMPGLPHTVTHPSFSHCAFTMKVRNFAPMMRAHGFHVTHYGVEGSVSGADEDVTLLTRAEHLELLGIESYDHAPTKLVGDYARDDSPVYRQFNYYLRDALKERLQPGDVFCLPFGYAHTAAYSGLPLIRSGEVALIESGIGYPKPATLTRVYESEAWRHWTLGNEMREGMDWRTKRLEWVVPNYYDLNDWCNSYPTPLSGDENRTVVYLGRLENVKGLQLLPLLARARPDLIFVICGQGDPSPFLVEPNIVYKEPIKGRDREAYFARARCGIFPSRFVEPFCGAAVECMLTGTPVITSDFGAFTETVLQGQTGYRCRTLPTFLAALDDVCRLERRDVTIRTAERYGLRPVGARYARVFDELASAMRGDDFANAMLPVEHVAI